MKCSGTCLSLRVKDFSEPLAAPKISWLETSAAIGSLVDIACRDVLRKDISELPPPPPPQQDTTRCRCTRHTVYQGLSRGVVKLKRHLSITVIQEWTFSGQSIPQIESPLKFNLFIAVNYTFLKTNQSDKRSIQIQGSVPHHSLSHVFSMRFQG